MSHFLQNLNEQRALFAQLDALDDVVAEAGIATVHLLGRDGGRLKALSDVAIVVPSATTARIQEAHTLIGHSPCGMAEQTLGLVNR